MSNFYFDSVDNFDTWDEPPTGATSLAWQEDNPETTTMGALMTVDGSVTWRTTGGSDRAGWLWVMHKT